MGTDLHSFKDKRVVDGRVTLPIFLISCVIPRESHWKHDKVQPPISTHSPFCDGKISGTSVPSARGQGLVDFMRS